MSVGQKTIPVKTPGSVARYVSYVYIFVCIEKHGTDKMTSYLTLTSLNNGLRMFSPFRERLLITVYQKVSKIAKT